MDVAVAGSPPLQDPAPVRDGLLETVVATTRAVVAAPERDRLFGDACAALVSHRAFAMAWIGADTDGDGWVERLAVAGDSTGYTERLRVSVHDVPEGAGPTGTAIRTGRPVVVTDVAADPRMAPWRERYLAAGFRSGAAFPLLARSLPTGVLCIYAPAIGAFGPGEAAALADLATTVGFALDALADRAALAESERRYRDLVDELDGVVALMDVTTGATYVSPQALAVFGYPPEQVAEPGFWRSLVVPEDRERTYAAWDGDADLDAYALEYRVLRADGRVIWIEERERAVRDRDGRVVGWHSVSMDVTARKAAEQADRDRAAMEERLGHVIRHARDIVLLIEPDGRIVDANEAALAAYGYTADEIRRRRVHELRAPDSLEGIDAQLAAAARPEGVLFETEHIRRDGSRFPVEVSSKAVTVHGKRYRQSIIRDITERKELQAQIARAARLESLGRLASGVAHDFNNLLWGIGVIGAAIGRHPGSPSIVDEAGEVVAAAEKGKEMTRALLAFARGGSSERGALDPGAFVRETAGLLERLLGPAVGIETVLPPGLPAVLVDAAGLSQALINLAVNARDAMPDGGRVTIALAPVALDEAAAAALGIVPGRYVEIAVADTGTGIGPDVLDRIFEPFFTTKPANIGTGLGLAVTYGFVKANDGGIAVESQPGAGTTFRLYLPKE